MDIGKLKINNSGIFSSKWDFYEYARHSVRWSIDSAKSLVIEIGRSSVLSDVPYTSSNNFYYQLLAGYTAAYWHYLYLSPIVPYELMEKSMLELKRGLDDGVGALKVGNDKINPYFVELYNYTFRRYLQGVMDDCKQVDDIDHRVFNPNVDNFTNVFIEDAKQLSLRDNQVEIDELKLYVLSQIIANIPLSVFESLAKMSVQYIPPRAGIFG